MERKDTIVWIDETGANPSVHFRFSQHFETHVTKRDGVGGCIMLQFHLVHNKPESVPHILALVPRPRHLQQGPEAWNCSANRFPRLIMNPLVETLEQAVGFKENRAEKS